MPLPEPAAGSLLHAVAARTLVGQATGVIMWRLNVGADEAAALLRRWSTEAGVDLTTMADSLVNVVCVPDHPRARELDLLRALEDKLRGHGPAH